MKVMNDEVHEALTWIAVNAAHTQVAIKLQVTEEDVRKWVVEDAVALDQTYQLVDAYRQLRMEADALALQKMDAPIPPAQHVLMMLCGPANEKIVTVRPDGTVEIHKEGSAPEAAKIFWNAIQYEGQTLAQQLAAAQAEIARLTSVPPEMSGQTLAALAAIPDCCASDDSMAKPQCFPLGMETAKRVLEAVRQGQIPGLQLTAESAAAEQRALKERLQDQDDEFLTLDGHDSACVGIGRRCSKEPLLVYSREKILENLVKQGMNEEEAEEYLEFNIAGAWVGDLTPIIVESLPE